MDNAPKQQTQSLPSESSHQCEVCGERATRKMTNNAGQPDTSGTFSARNTARFIGTRIARERSVRTSRLAIDSLGSVREIRR